MKVMYSGYSLSYKLPNFYLAKFSSVTNVIHEITSGRKLCDQVIPRTNTLNKSQRACSVVFRRRNKRYKNPQLVAQHCFVARFGRCFPFFTVRDQLVAQQKHLLRIKESCCEKNSAGLLCATNFGFWCSFFINLTTWRATNLLALWQINQSEHCISSTCNKCFCCGSSKLIMQGEKRETSTKTCNEKMLRDKLKVFVPRIPPPLNVDILVTRAHDPSDLRQASRALASSNTGSPRFTDFPSNLANLIGWEYETNTLRMLKKLGQPELSIPAAGQTDSGLWEREWNVDKNSSRGQHQESRLPG